VIFGVDESTYKPYISPIGAACRLCGAKNLKIAPGRTIPLHALRTMLAVKTQHFWLPGACEVPAPPNLARWSENVEHILAPGKRFGVTCIDSPLGALKILGVTMPRKI